MQTTTTGLKRITVCDSVMIWTKHRVGVDVPGGTCVLSVAANIRMTITWPVAANENTPVSENGCHEPHK